MSKIENLISKMTDNFTRNYLEIDNVFLGFEDYSTNGYILMSFVKELYDEEKCLLAIKTLFQHGANPNYLDKKGNNFIQVALETGYSENFMIEITAFALMNGLDVNHRNNDELAILDSALYSEKYKGGIVSLSKWLGLYEYNFDSVDFFGNDIVTSLDMFGKKEEAKDVELIKNYFKKYYSLQDGKKFEITDGVIVEVDYELNRILKPNSEK